MSHQHDRMIGRIERKVVGEGRDHITAYPPMGRIGVMLVELKEEGTEARFCDQLDQDAIQRLDQAGIEAEIYRLLGAVGPDSATHSRAFLRVIARNGEATTGVFRRKDILRQHVVVSGRTSSTIESKRGDS